MIGKILLAYDGSDNGRRAVSVAAELSAKLQADLCIVHVLMHGRPAEELVRMAEVEHLVQQAEQTLSPSAAVANGRPYHWLEQRETDGQSARVISAFGDLLVAYAKDTSQDLGAQVIKTAVRMGDYADKILEAADEMDVDMIVLGSRGLGMIRGTVLGSVSQKVLHHAKQTVVAVK